MSFLFTLLSRPPYLGFPQDMLGQLLLIVGWLFLVTLILLMRHYWRAYRSRWDRKVRGTVVGMGVSAAIASVFLGVQFDWLPGGLPPPGIPLDPHGPTFLVFAAVPWMIAGMLFGVLPSMGVAAISGIFLAFWETHSIFTPLEASLAALCFSVAIQQRYRTPFYRLLRRPLAVSVFLMLGYPFILLFDYVLLVGGSLATRLDYAMTHLWGGSLAFSAEILIAGVICQVFALVFPSLVSSRGPLRPSPAERSLEARFLYTFLPLIAILTILLIGAAWKVSENAARRMIKDRMINLARVTSEGVPYFLEAGQSLIAQLVADPQLLSDASPELDNNLQTAIRRVPFFTQLYVLDKEGNTIAGYPQVDFSRTGALVEEQTGIDRALDGVPFQTYTAIPQSGQNAAQVSFLAAIFDLNGTVRGVLIGRTSLENNPLTQPILANLDELVESGGEGILIDESGRILYHPQPGVLMTEYTGRIPLDADFFDETGADGTRRLVYIQPARGRAWAIALTVPARQAQEIAITIAAPLLGMILVLVLGAVLYFRYTLGKITNSLQVLADQSANMAQGQLDQPMGVQGEDEVGRLRLAFEQMRLSLRARLAELNRLLWVSQGVASSLEMGESVKPVLESALSMGASSARVALVPAVLPELEGDARVPAVYSAGPSAEAYRDLDEQILSLTRQQDRVVLNNPFRPRLIQYPAGVPVPESLAAVALRHESMFYGTLWIAFEQTHQFSEEEIRFLATLAGQAALAAANARHFLRAEIGRQRLEAILAQTPDPILVTDQRDRLLLANPAAWHALGLTHSAEPGVAIDKVVNQPELIDLLRLSAEDRKSIEVMLPDGKIYSATASTVVAKGKPLSRVCVMRDITYFKNLDALKSDFVANVSHDLRSPLTLMRGYSTMLEMVGTLNEQQVGYVRKIMISVESMSRMVNNLLDLGKIEAGIGLQLELVPAQDMLEKVVSSLQLQAAQKHVQLAMEIQPEGLPLIEADQALLQQALQNLVENAIKFTDADGKVTAFATIQNDHIVFAIQDTGIGIAPVDQPRLFDKFYRVRQPMDKNFSSIPGGDISTSRQAGGTGLGLAIVKSIAEQHHGKVWLESQLGKGSIFYLSVPLRQKTA